MKAIVVKKFGGPEVLELISNVPLPSLIGNQVRIKVKSAGVNPVDTYIRGNVSSSALQQLPYTPGKDGAGVVEACGANVKRFKVGDRVYFTWSVTGSYAEFCTVSEEHTFKLHDHLSFSQGAALGIPYFTAYRALVTKGQPKKGQSVLVHGASGGVGQACCQIAKHLDLKIFGTAGTEGGLDFIKKMGVHHAFNHKNPNYVEEIKKASGDGINIIIEMLADVNLEKDLELVSEAGMIVIVGSRGKCEITPRLFMTKELTLTGIKVSGLTKEHWLEMGEFFGEGQKGRWITPVVGEEYALGEAHTAHKEVIQHSQGSLGKIVLKID